MARRTTIRWKMEINMENIKSFNEGKIREL